MKLNKGSNWVNIKTLNENRALTNRIVEAHWTKRNLAGAIDRRFGIAELDPLERRTF